MIALSLAEIAAYLESELVFPPASPKVAESVVENISTDSRAIAKHCLFIALCGDRFDGHEFAAQAIKLGAIAILVERKLTVDVPQIIVADAHLALGKLAAFVRNKVNPSCIAITGSNGKTSVKEMLATILSQQHQVLFTAGNFNNDIGVPLTLLRLTQGDEYGVFELGANHIGEIDYTSSLVRPDIALVNNVASAHLEGFGSLDGVAKAKSEIFNHLNPNGTAVINANCQFADTMRKVAKAFKQISFGIDAQADVTATHLSQNAQGCFSFQLNFQQQSQMVNLPLAGVHQVSNALAATSMALAAGIDLQDIVSGLSGLTPVKGRMTPYHFGQLLLVDDSYNANPASVTSAINWLADLAGERILVLGDLAELGDNSESLHAELGLLAKTRKLDALLTKGDLSYFASEAFAGQHHSNFDSLLTDLRSRIQDSSGNITVLVKGSRSAAMENVVEALKAAYIPLESK